MVKYFRELNKKQHHMRLLNIMPEMKQRSAEQNKILLEFLSPDTHQGDKKTSREEKAMILFTNAMSICPLTDITVRCCCCKIDNVRLKQIMKSQNVCESQISEITMYGKSKMVNILKHSDLHLLEDLPPDLKLLQHNILQHLDIAIKLADKSKEWKIMGNATLELVECFGLMDTARSTRYYFTIG